MSYLYLREEPGLSYCGVDAGVQQVSGLGACVVPTTVSVRHLLCTNADLAAISAVVGRAVSSAEVRAAITAAVEEAVRLLLAAAQPLSQPRPGSGPGVIMRRSEEHTSELQSLRHLVCRLLLEKKKQKQNRYMRHSI